MPTNKDVNLCVQQHKIAKFGFNCLAAGKGQRLTTACIMVMHENLLALATCEGKNGPKINLITKLGSVGKLFDNIWLSTIAGSS